MMDTWRTATSPSFNVSLSIRLDVNQIKLDSGATGLYRWWLLRRKSWWERQVPAFSNEVRP